MTPKLKRGLAALVLTAGTVGVAAAPPASAHEGTGVLAVERREPTATGGIRYVVRLTWVNDGHAAIDSTLTATPIGPDGTPGTPIPLEAADQDGRYAAVVPLPTPGTWRVRVTAVKPAAITEVVEEVAPPASTSVPQSTVSAAPETPPPAKEDTRSGSDGADFPLFAAGLLMVVVGSGVAMLAYRWRRSP